MALVSSPPWSITSASMATRFWVKDTWKNSSKGKQHLDTDGIAPFDVLKTCVSQKMVTQCQVQCPQFYWTVLSWYESRPLASGILQMNVCPHLWEITRNFQKYVLRKKEHPPVSAGWSVQYPFALGLIVTADALFLRKFYSTIKCFLA